jgi:hypothetical protein
MTGVGLHLQDGVSDEGLLDEGGNDVVRGGAGADAGGAGARTARVAVQAWKRPRNRVLESSQSENMTCSGLEVSRTVPHGRNLVEARADSRYRHPLFLSTAAASPAVCLLCRYR